MSLQCLSSDHLSTSTNNLIVYLGRQSQQGSNPNEQSRRVTQIINHPNYNLRTNDNDISLLKLSSPVTFTTYILPVCLAESGSTFNSGTASWVTGWGNIGSDGGSENNWITCIFRKRVCTMVATTVFSHIFKC